MSINVITILLLTAVPFLLLLLHIFLSTRKSILWSIPAPVLWTALGIWIMAVVYKDLGFNEELLIFFLAGDAIMGLLTWFIRRGKRKKNI
ncbi:MAG TPA: hypothetical protein VN258_09430 [Mobilitalea sp.]|nr:hypothetical protein [Mobilitalea sp.]